MGNSSVRRGDAPVVCLNVGKSLGNATAQRAAAGVAGGDLLPIKNATRRTRLVAAKAGTRWGSLSLASIRSIPVRLRFFSTLAVHRKFPPGECNEKSRPAPGNSEKG